MTSTSQTTPIQSLPVCTVWYLEYLKWYLVLGLLKLGTRSQKCGSASASGDSKGRPGAFPGVLQESHTLGRFYSSPKQVVFIHMLGTLEIGLGTWTVLFL